MDEATQAVFNEIVAKDVVELSVQERAFIRARRTYLTQEEYEKFQEVLNENIIQNTTTQTKNKKPKKRMSLKKLTQKANKLGLVVGENMTSPQVKAMIDQFKYDQEAAAEQAELDKKAAEVKENEQAKVKGVHKGNFDSMTDDQKDKFN